MESEPLTRSAHDFRLPLLVEMGREAPNPFQVPRQALGVFGLADPRLSLGGNNAGNELLKLIELVRLKALFNLPGKFCNSCLDLESWAWVAGPRPIDR